MPGDTNTDHRRGQFYVALAAVSWSTAGVMQRELHVSTATQIVGRAVFAAIAITMLVVFWERGNTWHAFRSMGRNELALAVLMAAAMALFIFSLNHTSVANVLFMQALAPFVAVVLARLVLGESASRRTWTATFVAVAGVALMAGGPGSGPVIGLVTSFLMTAAFAATIVLVRHGRDVSMAPALALSQILVIVAFAGFAKPGTIHRHDLLFLVLLGFGQMGLGQAFFSIGARLIPATEVAVITLLEVVLGPLWVWMAFTERPRTLTLLGGAIVLSAVVLQATQRSAATVGSSTLQGSAA